MLQPLLVLDCLHGNIFFYICSYEVIEDQDASTSMFSSSCFLLLETNIEEYLCIVLFDQYISRAD